MVGRGYVCVVTATANEKKKKKKKKHYCNVSVQMRFSHTICNIGSFFLFKEKGLTEKATYSYIWTSRYTGTCMKYCYATPMLEYFNKSKTCLMGTANGNIVLNEYRHVVF